MAGRIHRIQYACNLPAGLLPRYAATYLTPVAPTLLVLGRMLYPDFFAWCSDHWSQVVYAPFATQGIGTERILHSAAMVQPPMRLAHFLPKENVVLIMASNEQRNEETYQYWTYRGASVVLLSKEPIAEPVFKQFGAPPAVHVYANADAATNSVVNGILSVSNPVLSSQGTWVSNYDKAAFFDIQTKSEQGCEVNPDLAEAAAAYMIERRPWTRFPPENPLK
jgi:hypothetical protein